MVCSHKVRDETCCRGSKTLRNKSARGSKEEGRLTSLCTDDQKRGVKRRSLFVRCRG